MKSAQHIYLHFLEPKINTVISLARSCQHMSDGSSNDELETLMNDFDFEITQSDENKKNLSEEELEELSKEDIANEYDVRFGKTPDGGTQHLLPPNKDNTHCNVAVTDNFRISEEPGPFDPICSNCKSSALGDEAAGASHTLQKTKLDLRQWLADEIDELREPESDSRGAPKKQLTKSELVAIILYIQSLKENQ